MNSGDSIILISQLVCGLFIFVYDVMIILLLVIILGERRSYSVSDCKPD